MKSHKSFLARKTNGHTLRLDGFITLMSLFGGFVQCPHTCAFIFQKKVILVVRPSSPITMQAIFH